MADTFKPLISPNTTHITGEHRINFMHSADTRQLTPEQYDLEFRALEYSLFSCCFFQALGAFFFFVVSFYVINDKLRAERQIASNADLIVAQESSQQPIYRGPAVDT